MRFMVQHKQGPKHEAGIVDETEVKTMTAFIGDAIKQGIFKDGAGLKPSAFRSRLRFHSGDLSVQHGPYKGENELMAGFALMKVKDRDEAIAWAKRFAEVVGGTLSMEIARLTGPWDLGLAPQPAPGMPLQYLQTMMTDAEEESDAPPSEQEIAAMTALMREMGTAGVLERAEGLLPSRHATRLTFEGGQLVSRADGPFRESKRLIGGFCIIEQPSREAALAWAEQYGAILRDTEVDLRPLHDQAAWPQ